jgi:hypothetical protein
MSLTLTYTGRPVNVTLQRFFWSHPEWWSLALCGFAWAVMLFHNWQYVGHGVHHQMTFAQETTSWMLMVAAMMLPVLIYTVRFTAFASLWARRHRAIAGFLGGYFAPWLALGIAVAALREWSWAHAYAATGLAFGVAALWQRTPMHRRALISCHRSWPLAPLGWRADLDCLHFGTTIGVACVRSCWPLMLGCALAAHSPIALAGCMVVSAVERLSFRPRTRTMLLVTLGMASYYLVLAGLDRGFILASQQPSAPQLAGSTTAVPYLEKRHHEHPSPDERTHGVGVLEWHRADAGVSQHRRH